MGVVRAAAGLIVATVLAVLVAAALPAAGNAKPPSVEARAWVVIDSRTGEELASHRPHARLGMASTTKLMTAWLAIHRLSRSKLVPAADYHGEAVESMMRLTPGEPVSVKDLLYGLILLSGNDAAETLAEAVSGTTARFVKLMNREARRLGLRDTGYRNPIGLDAKGHHTSAHDLARLSRYLMRLPFFRKLANSRTARLASFSPPREISTSDSFLWEYPWSTGIKSGFTQKSGHSLVSSTSENGVDLVAAMIGAPSLNARNRGSAKLLKYGLGLYRARVPLHPGRAAVRVPIERSGGQTLALVPKRRVALGVHDGQDLEIRVNAPERIDDLVRRGQRLGRARVLLNDTEVATVPLLARRNVPVFQPRSWFTRTPVLLAAGAGILLFVILAGTIRARRRRESETTRRVRRAVRRRP